MTNARDTGNMQCACLPTSSYIDVMHLKASWAPVWRQTLVFSKKMSTSDVNYGLLIKTGYLSGATTKIKKCHKFESERQCRTTAFISVTVPRRKPVFIISYC